MRDIADRPLNKRSDSVHAFASSESWVLLVGSNPERPFLIHEAARTASELGVNIVLLDLPHHRHSSVEYIADDRIIPLPKDYLTSVGVAAILNAVDRYAKHNQLVFDAVFTSLDTFVELAGVITTRLGARGNAEFLIRRAVSKSSMREVLSAKPGITTPYRPISSESEALAAYRDLEGESFVVKPVRGVGSRGVVTNIDSEDRMHAAWNSVRSYLDDRQTCSSGFLPTFNGNAEVLVEGQLQGCEVDVELVLQNGEVIFSAVSDNPHIALPLGVETSTTFPSQLAADIQEEIVRGASIALELLELTDGNFHVEMIYTEQGAKIVEVNTRMGGAFVWESIKAVYGVCLVELGIKAMLGRLVDAIVPISSAVVEACFFIPQVSGVVEKIDGIENLSHTKGFVEMRLWKRIGDPVLAPGDDPSDYLGFALYRGKTAREARQCSMNGLKEARFWIRNTAGDLVESNANHLHNRTNTVK